MLENYYWPAWLSVDLSGSDDAASEFFLDHPDGRIVSAFFLGFVFMNALQYVTHSTFLHDMVQKLLALLGRALSLTKPASNDVETPFVVGEKSGPHGETRSLENYNDHRALVFTLNLSFILASLGMLLSLLTYNSGNGSETVCAFVIAWGGMAARITRLIGFVILIVEFGKMGLRKWELWSLWASLFVALGFIFAFNATNTGTTSLVESLETVFCYRRHFLATALASSITHFVIELYLLVRLLFLYVPPRARLRDRLVGSKILAVTRVLSLLVLDLLTVVPDAISTNIFAQFIPFSVGAILVLTVFNRESTFARSPLPSLVVNARRHPTSDLLAPTPFALHFTPDAEHEREEVDPHSWCSHSPHAIPSSSRHSQAFTEFTGTSAELASTRSVENAVVTRASSAWRRSVRQIAFASPRSAPAQLAFYEQPHNPRKILQSQVEFAAELERHDNQWKSSQTSTPEPLQIAAGLQMPPSLHRSHIAIEMNEETESSNGPRTPASMVFGSDIIQLSPTRRRAEYSEPRSAAYTQSSFGGVLSPDSRRSTYRSFASSRVTDHTERTSDDSEERGSAISPRTSRSRSFLSPQSSIMRVPMRAINRMSFTSVRSRTTDELPTVRESETASASRPISARKSVRSKRTTFGQQSFSSMRRSKRPDAVTDLVVPDAPMPALTHLRASSSAAAPDATLPVPEVQFLPATPEPALAASPCSPSYWSERPMSDKIRGPRPLPSAWLTGSSWPQDTAARPLARAGSRRNSYPSPYAGESIGSIVDRRRPSVA